MVSSKILLHLCCCFMIVLSQDLSETVPELDANKSSSSSATVTRIAFGSCHKNHKAATPPIWETIAADSAKSGQLFDAWLWLGDAMYPFHLNPETNQKLYGPASPEEIRQGLAEMKTLNATIGYQDFVSGPSAPKRIAGVWDDHDFGGNDMGSNMPDKRERQKVYWDFLGYSSNEGQRRDDGGDYLDRDGMYHSVYLNEGQLGILVLDTRWFREDHCIPSVAHLLPMGNAFACLTRWLTSGLLLNKYAWLWGMAKCDENSLLGEDQWRWLEAELLSGTERQQHKTEAYLILSSIQVWSTNPAMESWGHFPREQERLWTLLQKHYAKSAAPVVFLSGDVHHAEIIGQPGYLEVTSSGLTHHCGQPKIYGHLCKPILEHFYQHRHRKDEYYIGLNYGVVEVNWEHRSLDILIKNATGETVLQVEQPLDGATPILPPYDKLPHTWNGHLIPYLGRLIWTVLLTFVVAKKFLRQIH